MPFSTEPERSGAWIVKSARPTTSTGDLLSLRCTKTVRICLRMPLCCPRLSSEHQSEESWLQPFEVERPLVREEEAMALYRRGRPAIYLCALMDPSVFGTVVD